MTQKYSPYSTQSKGQTQNNWEAQGKGSYGATDKWGKINGCQVDPKYPTDLMEHDHLLDDEHITGIFLKIDCNHNGNVSVAELMLFLARRGFKLDHKKCFAALDKFDCRADDDRLDLLEFIEFFRAAFPEKCDQRK